MAKESDHPAGPRSSEKKFRGRLPGLLANESQFDRRALWRLGSWGAGAVGALTVAALANQSSLGSRHDEVFAADLARQAQQLQSLTRDSHTETRQLASAIDTLNGDRDRLFSRVTVLEQGLDSVTGALARQNAAASAGSSAAPAGAKADAPSAKPDAPAAKPQAVSAATPAETPPSPTTPQAQPPAPAPTIGPVATTTAAPPTERARSEAAAAPRQTQSPAPATSPAASDQAAAAPAPSLPKIASDAPATTLLAPKSLVGPPDPAASKLIEPPKPSAGPAPAGSEVAAATPPSGEAETGPDNAPAKVERTEFAVDLGGANSVGGLRALWRGLSKSNAELAALRPIIMVKERSNGLGMQLRLAAGPLMDAAAAAKICANLAESERPCETTVFDGQRLALRNEETEQPAPAPAAKSAPVRSRHSVQKRARNDDPPRSEPSALSALFGRK